MKTIILLIILLIFSACGSSNDTKVLYKYKIEVTYINGDKQVIRAETDCNDGAELERDDGGSYISIGCYTPPIAYVRSFKILSKDSTVINN